MCLTGSAERCSGPSSVVAARTSSFVRKPVATAIVEHVSVVHERSDVETRLQRSVRVVHGLG